MQKAKDKGESLVKNTGDSKKEAGSMRAAGLFIDLLSQVPMDELTRCDAEFELVTQALWTDPADQSGWLYHRWLIGSNPSEEILRRELKNVRELHETEPDSKCELFPHRHCGLLLETGLWKGRAQS